MAAPYLHPVSSDPARCPASAEQGLDCQTILLDVADVIASIARGPWRTDPATRSERVHEVHRVHGNLRQHIQEMEGWGGMLHCIVQGCPRLLMGVKALSQQHQTLLGQLDELAAALDACHGSTGEKRVTAAAAAILHLMREHYDAGNSLVIEAFATDLGLPG